MTEPDQGVLGAGKVNVEAPVGALVHDLLFEVGWKADEPWTPLRRDLMEPVKDPGVRVEVQLGAARPLALTDRQISTDVVDDASSRRPVGGARYGGRVHQPADLENVRASYDRVADTYVELGMGDLSSEPWLRGALSVFAETVAGLGPVLDVGCGPGTVTAHLTELGLDVSGVDLSPRMVAHARRRYPGLQFAVGSATALDLAPASLGGILGWWSLFNLPRDVLPKVLATFAEALVPGGQVLIGTHVGDEDLERTEAYNGIPVSWTTHLWRPEALVGLLEGVGLEVVVELRWPATPPVHRPQVLLAAQRPA